MLIITPQQYFMDYILFTFDSGKYLKVQTFLFMTSFQTFQNKKRNIKCSIFRPAFGCFAYQTGRNLCFQCFLFRKAEKITNLLQNLFKNGVIKQSTSILVQT